MPILCLIAPDPVAAPDIDVLTHAVIQLLGSGGLGTLLVYLWTMLKSKLDDINEADEILGERIDKLDKDIDGRFDALQTEIARKANADSVAALEGRVMAVEREGRERSRRLHRVEVRAEMAGPGSSVVAPIVHDDVPAPR